MAPADAAAAALRTFVAEARVDLATAAREAARVEQRAGEAAAVPTPAMAVLIGWHLNRFYTAVESLHERIARAFEGNLPSGERWHADLLDRMTIDLGDVRPAVLSEGTRAALALYLDFRHLFRRIYRADLEWEPMEHLVRRLPVVASAWRDEVTRFLAFVERAASAAGGG